jgi:hypothetical protein
MQTTLRTEAARLYRAIYDRFYILAERETQAREDGRLAEARVLLGRMRRLHAAGERARARLWRRQRAA